jgi:hypothetical protein
LSGVNIPISYANTLYGPIVPGQAGLA